MTTELDTMLECVQPVQPRMGIEERHTALARLIVLGWGTKEIAAQIFDNKVPVTWVRKLCRSPQVGAEVERLRPEADEIMKLSIARLRAAIPAAIDFWVDTLLDDSEDADPKWKHEAAKEVTSRGGIPALRRIEKFSLQTTLTSAELQELDRAARATAREGRLPDVRDVVDVTPAAKPSTQGELTDAVMEQAV